MGKLFGELTGTVISLYFLHKYGKDLGHLCSNISKKINLYF